MSGFDPAWLALREPADHAARNRDVLYACAAHFGGRAKLSIVDLGCGAGSNLRALAPHLADDQRWRLVDHDPALLRAARDALCAWADDVDAAGERLTLAKCGRRITVEFATVDLAQDLDRALAGDVDLVTAAALFDLVSEDWMSGLGDRIAARKIPLYAVLTYNGVERWSPPDPHDAAMLVAFHTHQAREKGFGPATGPRAAEVLRRLMVERGYAATEGDSDWVLSSGDQRLVQALAEGVAGACRETGLVAPGVIAAWRTAREDASVRIGHTDLFAHKP